MASNWGDRPIHWSICERILKCTLHEETTGEHRHFMLCNRKFITGPRDDFPVQLGCFFWFTIALGAWILASIFLVANTNILLCIVPFVSWILALFCFLHCGFVDPGIYPLNKIERVPLEVDSENPPEADIVAKYEQMKKHPQYCRECRFVRDDIGTYHCGHCNVCVKELDHHCGVVGNCIGARNKSTFVGVILFAQTTITGGIINAILGGIHAGLNGSHNLDSSIPFQIICWILACLEAIFIIVSFVFCLAFHFGRAEDKPFSYVGLIFRGMLSNRFFSYSAKRERITKNTSTIMGCFAGEKCTVVPSLVFESEEDLLSTMNEPSLLKNAQAQEISSKASDEMPLNPT